MFVLFLFQCIQLTSNVFWQLNFFLFFFMIILRLVVVNFVRSIWMLIPIIHCDYPQNFWICIVLDITLLPFTVSTSIIKEYVVLCNCLVTFISVYYLLHIMLRVWHIHSLNLIIFLNTIVWVDALVSTSKNFSFLNLFL